MDETTVLIVDDQDQVRHYIRSHLEPRYRVIEASGAREGLEQAHACLPDLVLCDVMMPDVDGYAFCRALKADPDLDFIPVVLLTARADGKLEGLRDGADDYVVKPFDAAELVARIDNLIAQRQRLRDKLLVRMPEPKDRDTDDDFMLRARDVVERCMADAEFDVETLAFEMGVSRASLYRRLQELDLDSPHTLIQGTRLERAAQLLSSKSGTISEVAYAVGFKSVAHFSRRFHDHFGTPPSRFVG